MIQVSYVSTATANMSSTALSALLDQSTNNNAAAGITGMLLYGNGTFLQLLEGDEPAVDALLLRILRDPRHHGARILHRRAVTERQYPGWNMGFQQVSTHSLTRIDGLGDLSIEDFDAPTLERYPDVLQSIHDHFRRPHFPAWDPLWRELEAKEEQIRVLNAAMARSHFSLQVAGLVLESVAASSGATGTDAAPARLCGMALGEVRQALGVRGNAS